MAAEADGGTVWGDGYRLVPLPAGRIAAIVTYLEMTAPPAPATPVAPAPGWRLARVADADPAWYRRLFRRVGQPWLWYSRLVMDDGELASILGDPAVELHVLTVDGVEEGVLELDRRRPGQVEIAFFGLTPAMTGRGAGRFLLQRALTLAWQDGVARVWVHTCTLDHPAALPLYRKMGFRPYAQAVEVERDPRLTGLLPADAAPQVPVIRPDEGPASGFLAGNQRWDNSKD